MDFTGCVALTQATRHPLSLQSLAFLSDLLLSSLTGCVHWLISFVQSLLLGNVIRETKPTGCEVYQHGLSLLLPKAVVLTAGPLSPHGVQLLCSQPHFHLSIRKGVIPEKPFVIKGISSEIWHCLAAISSESDCLGCVEDLATLPSWSWSWS